MDLGVRPYRVALGVTLPLIAPAMLAGGCLPSRFPLMTL